MAIVLVEILEFDNIFKLFNLLLTILNIRNYNLSIKYL
jgi:hypothetical protein